MTELAVRQPTQSPVPTMPTAAEFELIVRQAEYLATSTIIPSAYRKQPGNVVVATLTGRTFGWDALTSMRNIVVIEGTASLKPESMLGLVRRSGHSVSGTIGNDGAQVSGTRRDTGDTMTCQFTLDDAKRAGLAGKKNWQNYPASMCWARAVAQLCRSLFPDVVLGLGYVPDELGAVTDEEGSPVAPPERRPVEQPTSGTERLRAAIAQPAAEPAAEPEQPPGPEPITPKQLTGINAGMTDLGITDKAAKYAWLTDQLGRDIASSKDVTKAEASALMDGFASGRFAPAVTTVVDDDVVDAVLVEDPPMGWDEAYGDEQAAQAGA